MVKCKIDLLNLLDKLPRVYSCMIWISKTNQKSRILAPDQRTTGDFSPPKTIPDRDPAPRRHFFLSWLVYFQDWCNTKINDFDLHLYVYVKSRSEGTTCMRYSCRCLQVRTSFSQVKWFEVWTFTFAGRVGWTTLSKNPYQILDQ